MHPGSIGMHVELMHLNRNIDAPRTDPDAFYYMHVEASCMHLGAFDVHFLLAFLGECVQNEKSKMRPTGSRCTQIILHVRLEWVPTLRVDYVCRILMRPGGIHVRVERTAVHLDFYVHVIVQSKPQRHVKQKMKPSFFGFRTLNCHPNACRSRPRVRADAVQVHRNYTK
jgi:hypothetical protein